MKTGRYTAQIEARRAREAALNETDAVKVKLDFSALFSDFAEADRTETKEEMEARVEQEILDQFGGYDNMVETFEAEIAGAKSMTAAEAIAYLRNLGDA